RAPARARGRRRGDTGDPARGPGPARAAVPARPARAARERPRAHVPRARRADRGRRDPLAARAGAAIGARGRAGAMSDAAPLGPVRVTGANVSLGRAGVARLARDGAVRAVVRSERAAATVRALPAAPEVAVIDYRDAETLARAAAGCTAVVHLVGILKEAPGTSYADAHERTARALADAALRADCHRIVYLSILGARAGSPNACLASKARAEAILLAP